MAANINVMRGYGPRISLFDGSLQVMNTSRDTAKDGDHTLTLPSYWLQRLVILNDHGFSNTKRN
ncbi:hypothetical protein KIN20_016222 [Parelaphostrongylus tenuis]|uniref:Uncharacterized protein n=1 Tax=Parelaphostrongylus tenuis TaxID=148309 RepID=A0AAD5MG46_PARTN|nr:hypothetical protein KIN20_016222 [Parelaphostrongylus tenuis]